MEKGNGVGRVVVKTGNPARSVGMDLEILISQIQADLMEIDLITKKFIGFKTLYREAKGINRVI